jgi:glucokinase
MKKCAIGIDIGGTNTKLGLVTDQGLVYFHDHFRTEDYPEFIYYQKELFERINRLIISYQSSFEVRNLSLVGIGIGAPNANFHTGFLESPVNIPWGSVALKSILETRFKLPVVLDNDANAAALGEAQFGVAKNVADFILVTLGTGVGSGIFSQNKILRSTPGKAGEGGHLTIVKDGRSCGCGGLGHLESYCSSKGVRLTAEEMMGQSLGAREISDLFIQNNPMAIEVVDFTAKCLGFGLSQMCALLNPTLIVLGGGVSLLSPDLAERTEQWLKHYTFRAIRDDAHIEISQLQTKQGSVLGAATLVF